MTRPYVGRRRRNAAKRAAWRYRRKEECELTPAEYGSIVLEDGGRTSIMFDESGNALEVDIDRDRFAAAIERLDPANRLARDCESTTSSYEDDCPICCALREAMVGEPRRAWALDG